MKQCGLVLVQKREVEMGCEMRMDQPPKQNIVNGTPDLDRGVIGMILECFKINNIPNDHTVLPSVIYIE